MDERNLPTKTGAALPAERSPAPVLGDPIQEETPQGGVAVKRMLAALLRYKWLILVVTVTGTAGAVWASRYLPLRYQAEATLWFEVADRSPTGPIQTQGALPASAWIELLGSFYILDQVARDQALYVENAPRDSLLMKGFRLDSMFIGGRYRLRIDPQGRTAELQTEGGQRLEQVRAGDPIGLSRGFVWHPPASAYEPRRVVAFEVLHPREAARKVGRQLNVGLPKGGNVVTLRYVGSEPRRVAGVVNAVADLFTATAVELKASQQGVLSDALIKQLATAQETLTQAERALENFHIQTATLPSAAAANPEAPLTQAPALAMNAYFNHTLLRENAQRDLEAIERALGSNAAMSTDLLVSIPAITRAPEVAQALGELTGKRAALRTLLQTHTPQHVTVQRALADIDALEKVTIPQLTTRLTAELAAEVQRLDAVIVGNANELRSIPSRTLEEARLRRSVTHAERLYNDLRFRYETALLAREATMPEVRVLDRAFAPVKPQLDPRLKLIAVGFLASLGLSLMVALTMDRFDPRLRYADQVSRDMGLTIVGAIPDLAARNGRKLASSEKSAEVLEALRGIRLNLINAYGSAGPLHLTITSPGSGDGKTFLTSNLALAFAELGYRTLVIDGDTRRGTMHRLFSLDRQPGLTDYLSGTVQLAEVIRSTTFPLVDVLPSGRRMTNAPELLSSNGMGDLIAYSRSRYDAILIDSPPLTAGIDPLVLATLSANVLLVMRTGVTSRTIADAKLAMLDRLPVRILGAILNGFDSGEAYRYYSYLPGYESHGEGEPVDEPEKLQPA
ncbi:polysaccharide biosynthesis tyrosine autokinase [soil metagenome]